MQSWRRPLMGRAVAASSAAQRQNSRSTPPCRGALFKTSLKAGLRGRPRRPAGVETPGHRGGSRSPASRPRQGRSTKQEVFGLRRRGHGEGGGPLLLISAADVETAAYRGRRRRDRGEGGGAPRRILAAGVETAAREAGRGGSRADSRPPATRLRDPRPPMKTCWHGVARDECKYY